MKASSTLMIFLVAVTVTLLAQQVNSQGVMVAGYLNVTDDGYFCTQNSNCTSGFCSLAMGQCQSACITREPKGNYSNGCYCEKNYECSSMYCNNQTIPKRCQSISTTDTGFWCEKNSDCFMSRCDFVKHQCTPFCRIGECFCTLDDDCDSGICYKYYCKSLSRGPAWVLVVAAFIILVFIALCIVWKMKHVNKYYVVTAIPTVGQVWGPKKYEKPELRVVPVQDAPKSNNL